ncbi:MAG: 3-deoxy-D-manno-octulosonic-acid transferase [Halocynthiibacter sp.]|jgi:3-deoxy-D-manno-octulosonic-acid transferase
MILYRLLFGLIAPLLLAKLAFAQWRGRGEAGALWERLGFDGAGGRISRGPMIWVHGASLGEVTAARPLISAALARDPKLEFIVTANTATGRSAVEAWALDRVHSAFAPLDYRFAQRRFLGRWLPEALIVIENEIWPNRFVCCAKANIPIVFVGARLSEKSAKFWRLFGARFGRAVFGAVGYLGALDPASEERLRLLGVPERAIGPNILLKGSVSTQSGDTKELALLRQAFDRDRTFLAASTHEGEDGTILRAFAQCRAAFGDIRLIIAPRHPDRGDEICALIKAAGLSVARRSKGEDPAKADVYLADTLGEMGLWFQLAGISFVGGSFVPKGGHTPFEPAQFGSAILHGPYTENNAAAYRALAASGGALPLTSAQDLAHTLRSLFAEPSRARTLSEAATRALAPMRRDDDGQRVLWARIAALTSNPALK